MPDLKPCPFCGGEAEMDTRQSYRNFVSGTLGTGIAVYCRECGAQHMVCRGDVPDVEPEHVIDLWNRRADLAIPAELAELMRAGDEIANAPNGLARAQACGRAHKALDAYITARAKEGKTNGPA